MYNDDPRKRTDLDPWLQGALIAAKEKETQKELARRFAPTDYVALSKKNASRLSSQPSSSTDWLGSSSTNSTSSSSGSSELDAAGAGIAVVLFGLIAIGALVINLVGGAMNAAGQLASSASNSISETLKDWGKALTPAPAVKIPSTTVKVVVGTYKIIIPGRPDLKMNIREQPLIDSKLLGQAAYGTCVRVTETGFKAPYVKVDAVPQSGKTITGFVDQRYLQPANRSIGNCFAGLNGDTPRAVAKAPVIAGELATIGAKGGAYLRAGPNEFANKKGILNVNSCISVKSQFLGYARVEGVTADGKVLKGYVHERMLEASSLPAAKCIAIPR